MSSSRRVNKQMWNNCTMEYHSEIKRNTLSRQPTTQRGIKNTSLSERSQKSKKASCESLLLWCPNGHMYSTIKKRSEKQRRKGKI